MPRRPGAVESGLGPIGVSAPQLCALAKDCSEAAREADAEMQARACATLSPVLAAASGNGYRDIEAGLEDARDAIHPADRQVISRPIWWARSRRTSNCPYAVEAASNENPQRKEENQAFPASRRFKIRQITEGT
jgi:hypothetical protein